ERARQQAEARRMPDPVAHAEDRTARVRHENEGRNRQSGPKDRRPRGRDPTKSEEESREDRGGPHRAADGEGNEARSEKPKEKGLEIGSDGTEPVDDVPVEEIAPRQTVRVDPFGPDVDDRVA